MNILQAEASGSSVSVRMPKMHIFNHCKNINKRVHLKVSPRLCSGYHYCVVV